MSVCGGVVFVEDVRVSSRSRPRSHGRPSDGRYFGRTSRRQMMAATKRR